MQSYRIVVCLLLLLFTIPCFGQVPLPGEGTGPIALSFDHFPSRMHAFVWRNWPLVPSERLAAVLGTTTENVEKVARSVGLPPQEEISPYWQSSRGYITVLKRNWHLLPYEQLVELLGTDREQLAYSLREDDFLFIKLGSIKPQCEPLRYAEPTAEQKRRAAQIAGCVRRELGENWYTTPEEPRFAFIDRFSQVPEIKPVDVDEANESAFELRYIYSYFATFGDPLLDPTVDSYPDGLLRQLKESGVNGVWLHTVLRTLVPPSELFPEFGDKHEIRLQSLRTLVQRAKKYGIQVYLYVNEPRAMHESFFETPGRKKLAGVREGDHLALCTSRPEVRQWLTNSMTYLFENVPDLGGVFTITASENLTSCASHHQHGQCPNCKDRSFADILVEVNTAIEQGVHRGNPNAKVIVWDWGWQDAFAEEIINRLPKSCRLMSVSEWSQPIKRGGIDSVVGEYSISNVGPGPRASQHWEFARKAGLKPVAKVQVNATWEMSAVPYIPALERVAQHGLNLSQAGVNGLMLSWSVGGYPSANLDLFRRFTSRNLTGQGGEQIDAIMRETAASYFGEEFADVVVQDAWRKASESFAEYPYHIGTMYSGPQQVGPSNLFFRKPTGYHATMVGFPYDDLNAWRSVFPPEIYVSQMTKSATGFGDAANCFRKLADSVRETSPDLAAKFDAEVRVATAVQVHFLSVANQAKFVLARDANDTEAMRRIVQDELELVKAFFPVVKADSRIGFEASNHYYYVPIDLAEKVVNCCYLLE
ncbi:MAG: alpha-amylase family protein [Planctomycetaceae bacterium]|nr:alpha-amylase family protein [Planctomycetaceae bacterium]